MKNELPHAHKTMPTTGKNGQNGNVWQWPNTSNMGQRKQKKKKTMFAHRYSATLYDKTKCILHDNATTIYDIFSLRISVFKEHATNEHTTHWHTPSLTVSANHVIRRIQCEQQNTIASFFDNNQIYKCTSRSRSLCGQADARSAHTKFVPVLWLWHATR